MASVDKVKGKELANRVAREVMKWEEASGAWETAAGDKTGFKCATSDDSEEGTFRPDLDWNHMAKVIDQLNYCYLYLTDQDVVVPSKGGPVDVHIKAGQWECKMVRERIQDKDKDLFVVADTATLAICRAALKIAAL